MNREATDLAGVRHETYETLGSTNAEALARARAGERGALWISAKAQDAGRGRRGSAWTSSPGNLFATLLLSDPSPPPLAPQLSFVAALALHDARDFDAALKAFQALAEVDPPSKVYAERCKGYLELAPPPDWRGEFALKTK